MLRFLGPALLILFAGFGVFAIFESARRFDQIPLGCVNAAATWLGRLQNPILLHQIPEIENASALAEVLNSYPSGVHNSGRDLYVNQRVAAWFFMSKVIDQCALKFERVMAACQIETRTWDGPVFDKIMGSILDLPLTVENTVKFICGGRGGA